MAENYVLRVTAGSTYDTKSHVEVPVNTPTPVKIRGAHADIELNVRIRDYRGLPRGSPANSPYFAAAPHAANGDQYSIAFRFTPRAAGGGAAGISAHDLQFGNDFDRPIRDRLPPGFNTALNIVKWWIDPGLDGDAYADTPHLYGPALSSFNVVHAGAGEFDADRGGLWFEEGGDENGSAMRQKIGAPETTKERMRWALKKESKDDWLFENGRTYGLDFFNSYLDFSNLALRLPGYHLPIMKYWDGQGLRYVLRNRATSDTYLVVLITIHHKDQVNEDGTLKSAPVSAKSSSSNTDDEAEESHDEQAALDEARKQLGATHSERSLAETSIDDVD